MSGLHSTRDQLARNHGVEMVVVEDGFEFRNARTRRRGCISLEEAQSFETPGALQAALKGLFGWMAGNEE